MERERCRLSQKGSQTRSAAFDKAPFTLGNLRRQQQTPTSLPIRIGLYRENAIAIESEARDPFRGNVYYVTMQITFPIPECARNERNLHCDVVHVTTKWVSRLVLDHAIAAIQTSR